jgi:hypothetical protein
VRHADAEVLNCENKLIENVNIFFNFNAFAYYRVAKVHQRACHNAYLSYQHPAADLLASPVYIAGSVRKKCIAFSSHTEKNGWPREGPEESVCCRVT